MTWYSNGVMLTFEKKSAWFFSPWHGEKSMCSGFVPFISCIKKHDLFSFLIFKLKPTQVSQESTTCFSPFLTKIFWSTEWFTWKGLQLAIWSNLPASRRVIIEHMAPNSVQTVLKYLRWGRLHLSGQSVPVQSHKQNKELLPCIRSDL